MRFLELIAEKWHSFCEKIKPGMDKTGEFLKKAKEVSTVVWKFLVRLRKVFLAIPVAWGAIYLGIRNMKELPDVVGLNLQIDGTFAIQIARELAVLGPIAITALCLLLMFCSRRTLTPWLVSVFTLALPIFILVINIFPA